MSSNPYSDNDQQSPYAFQSQLPSGSGDFYIKQIPVVGILQIVQAALELMMGVLLIGAAIMMGLMQNNPQIQKMPNPPPMQIFSIGYSIFGAVVGVVALLRLTSGIMILRKRARMFSIVTSVLGLASVFTCYCSPTSIALCVYTLIVLVQPSVIDEFDKALAASDLDSAAGLK